MFYYNIMRYSYYSRSALRQAQTMQIIIPLIIATVYGLIFGFVVRHMYENKGYDGGFWVGFFLGIIGVIIAATKPDISGKYYNYSATDDYIKRLREGEDNKYKPTNNTMPTHIVTSSNGEWRCPRCNRINASYVGTCGCGFSKKEFEAKQRAAENQMASTTATASSQAAGATTEPSKAPTTEDMNRSHAEAIQAIKDYKELLDMGAITQEEYDAKKKQLLDL